MARSNSTDFSITGGDIVRDALNLITERAAEVPATSNEIDDGLRALNRMVKAWQGQGLHLWKLDQGILFLDDAKASYNLGPQGDEAALLDDFIDTTLTVAGSVSDILLTVASTVGMTGAVDSFSNGGPFTNTTGWSVGNSGTVAVSGDNLELTNGAATAGFTEFTVTTVVGESYIMPISFVLGTATGATFTIREGATILDTVSFTATGTDELEFTATQLTHTFRFANDSAGITETSSLDSVQLLDTNSGDFIGIELDDNTRQWTHIVTVDSATQVRIETALTGAAAIANTVFTFSTLIDRPLRIHDTRRTRISDTSEIDLNKWSQQQYFAQTNKQSTGTPTNFYYDPKLDNGRIYIWQTASSVNQLVKFTFESPIQDFDVATNNPDFPIEWSDALVWNLAARIGHEYNTPLQKMQLIIARATQLKDDMLGWDEELTSLNIQPSRSR